MSAPAPRPSPSANRERLSQRYDPAYVRRIETLNGGDPVQVCLETRMLRDEAGTGVATYARVLSQCLAAAGAAPILLDDGDHERPSTRSRAGRLWSAARRAGRPAIASAVDAEPDRWRVPDVFREAQVFFDLHGRPLPIAFARPPAVMHWTYPIPIFLIGAKNLYTVHDLIPLKHPDLTPIPAGRHARILRAVAAQAHAIVTVSETVRRDVIAHLGVPNHRVINTYQAVEAPLQSDPPLPEGLRSGRYFLFCGRVETRKNLERLARAHAASGVSLPLVIIGPQLQESADLEARLSQFPNLVRLPWAPRSELIGLLRRARALLFPSLAEGFGLPIVEAMAVGCPVLTSDRGATAEIAGDAALLVDPERVDAMAAAIAALAVDDRLTARLRASGFERCRMFSREAYARRLRGLYDAALTDGLAVGAVRP